MRKTTFDYASKHYKPQDSYYSKADEIRAQKVLKFIGRGKKVLDLGCFDGTIGQKIAAQGNQVWGIDASAEVVKQARKNNVKAQVGDVTQKLTFKEGFFDVVFAGEILEHIVDTDFFLAEIKRVLKPKGTLIITTPNVASLGRRLLLLFGKNPYLEASLGFPTDLSSGHVRFYTKDLLISFLEHKGFEVVCFESDIVNLSSKIYSKRLANIFPTLGRTLLVKAKLVYKQKD
ncbi:MAG: class I SAM-dependent methyltransferase [Patescibacteria group bacterium]|jgi:2-polyprenyl-3-methyl-5-hydroxy-6-metoxy-1,4-benzoquinol methylase